VTNDEHEMRKLKNQKRFEKHHNGTASNTVRKIQHFKLEQNGVLSSLLQQSETAVVGFCTDIEKDFYRLTSVADPSTVRPKNILQISLARLLEKRKKRECPYVPYICSQLKAIRQDLTIQHIKDAFTIEVYEAHARIALEEGDINEFNQCQTQLIELYKDLPKEGCQCEFSAYRILYSTFLQGKVGNELAIATMTGVLSALTEEHNQHKSVIHANRVRQAVEEQDYYRFFLLYKTVPNLGICLMKKMESDMRLVGLTRILSCIRPKVSVSYIAKILAFQSVSECAVVLDKCNITYQPNQKGVVVDTKLSMASFNKNGLRSATSLI